MKNFTLLVVIILVTFFYFSCSYQLQPGKYVNSQDKSCFEIDNSLRYNFTTTNDVHKTYMFSKGFWAQKNREITFIPDSSYFFQIRVSKYYYDSTIRHSRKIIINLPDSVFFEFSFSFTNGPLNPEVTFSNTRSVTYTPLFTSNQDGSIVLKAKLKDTSVVLPRLLRASLLSNRLSFFDVNNDDPDDKAWNVLELKVNISRDMFAFTELPIYIFRKKKLVPKDIPVYQLQK